MGLGCGQACFGGREEDTAGLARCGHMSPEQVQRRACTMFGASGTSWGQEEASQPTIVFACSHNLSRVVDSVCCLQLPVLCRIDLLVQVDHACRPGVEEGTIRVVGFGLEEAHHLAGGIDRNSQAVCDLGRTEVLHGAVGPKKGVTIGDAPSRASPSA
jgi:hypothetical protein